MGYNLSIDQGNSAAKVALFDGHELIETWRCDNTLNANIIGDIIANREIDAAIYCAVAGHGEESIVTLRGIAKRVYELTSLLPLPISVDYASPSTLGRDRIAAAVGAWTQHRDKDILVVDAGTAITYDLVSADGHFIGGNIAPGLWMRAEALHRMTDRLPLVDVESPGDVPLWGSDTQCAILSGVVRGAVGELTYYHSLLPAGAKVILTGGDAMRLASLVDFEVETDPLLVNKGLNSILLYNENF